MQEGRWVRMNGRRFGMSEFVRIQNEMLKKQALCKQMQDEEIKAEVDRVLDRITSEVNACEIPDPYITWKVDESIAKRAAMRRECLIKRKLLADYLIGIRMGVR